MIISTRGRYALRVMVDLAERDTSAYIPLKVVAEEQQISEKYLESIVKSLVQNGLLEGVRGKGGGYRLKVRPEQCTIGKVLKLTEVGLAPVSCLEEGAAPCPRAAKCRTLPMWKKLDGIITDFFGGITIADLMQKPGMIEDEPCAADLETPAAN